MKFSHFITVKIFSIIGIIRGQIRIRIRNNNDVLMYQTKEAINSDDDAVDNTVRIIDDIDLTWR